MTNKSNFKDWQKRKEWQDQLEDYPEDGNHGIGGYVYPDGSFICESTGEDVSRHGRWFLFIENQSWMKNNLEALEEILYFNHCVYNIFDHEDDTIAHDDLDAAVRGYCAGNFVECDGDELGMIWSDIETGEDIGWRLFQSRMDDYKDTMMARVEEAAHEAKKAQTTPEAIVDNIHDISERVNRKTDPKMKFLRALIEFADAVDQIDTEIRWTEIQPDELEWWSDLINTRAETIKTLVKYHKEIDQIVADDE